MVEDRFVQVFLKEYTNSIAKNFKNFLDDDLYVDLIFICCKNTKVKAHQIVLAYLSNFLYKILTENQYDSSGKVTYVCVPDVHFKIMEQIIQFLYTGQITLNAKDLKEFHETMQLLGMPSCTFTHTDEASSSTVVGICVETKKDSENEKIRGLTLSSVPFLPVNQKDSGCIVSSALKNDEDTTCIEGLIPLPTISEVKSLSKPPIVGNSHLSSLRNLPTVSSVAANLLNNEESIKKIAKTLFVQLKKMSLCTKKLRNDKIRSRYNSSRHLSAKKKKKDSLEEQSSLRKIDKRSRYITRQVIGDIK